MLTAAIVAALRCEVICPRADDGTVQMCPRADAAHPGLWHLLPMNASFPLAIPDHLSRKQTRSAA